MDFRPWGRHSRLLLRTVPGACVFHITGFFTFLTIGAVCSAIHW